MDNIFLKAKTIDKLISESFEKNNEFSFNPLEYYILNDKYKTIISNNNESSSEKYSTHSSLEINNYFIDNFNSAIKCLKNGDHFECIRKDELESFPDKNTLNELQNISYFYIYNKKIIIDFQEIEDSSKSFFIIPSPQKNSNDKIIFIISVNNKNKKEIFKSLLKENINKFSDIEIIKKKYKLADYGYRNIYNDKQKMERIKVQIKILILIYYYEKLLKNNELPRNYQSDYYLVNFDWIVKYKNYYYYKNFSDLLDKKINNNNINFNNIGSFIEDLIERFQKEYIYLIPQKPMYHEFESTEKIMANLIEKDNLKYYNSCYIISPKIFESITKLEFKKSPLELKMKASEISYNKEDIFINIDLININIGIMKDLVFVIKYIISYNSKSDFWDFKKNYLFQKPMSYYIRKNLCSENSNEIQIMKNENVGKLLILNNDLKSSNFENKSTIRNRKHFTNQRANSNKNIIPQYSRNSTSPAPNKRKNNLFKSIPKKIISQREHQISLLNEQLQKERGLNEEYKNNEKKLNDKIEEYKNKEKQLNDKIEEYKNNEKNLNDKIEEYKNNEKKLNDKIEEFTNNEEKLNDKIEELKNNEKKNIKKIELNERNQNNYNEKIEDLINENKKMNEKLLTKINEYKNLKNEYEYLKEEKEKKAQLYFSKEEEYKTKEKDIQKREEILNLDKNNLNNIKLEYENTIEQLKKKKQEIQDLTKKEKEFLGKLNLSESNKKIEYSQNSLYNYFKSNFIFNNINRNNNSNNQIQFNKVSHLEIKIEGLKIFMNPILQCFIQTKPLINYFLNINNKKNILVNQSNHQQSSLNLKLFENFWKNITRNNMNELYSFINRIEKMNYNNNKIGFAKDLIIFILKQLDSELIQQKNGLNKFFREQTFENFFNEFNKKSSIINEIFFGFIESKSECLNCKRIFDSQNLKNPICYSYEIFKYFIFPLEKIKDMKNNSNNNAVSIYDCFQYNQRDIILNGSYCNNCKNISDFNISSKILVGPNILIIILDRGNNNPYVKLDIQLTIDLTNYILKKDYPTMIYNLYGIFSYSGNDTSSSNITYYLNENDNHWYKYNNEGINPINDIPKNFIESVSPSILFYKKQNYNSNIFKNLFD